MGEWKKVKLKDICDITTGKLNANAMKEDGKYPFFTCAKESYRIDEYAFDAEAILISGNGANVGYVNYYKGKFNAYQRTYVLMNFKENAKFIKYQIENQIARIVSVEKSISNTPYIVLSTIENIEINILNDKRKESIILQILEENNDLCNKINEQIKKCKIFNEALEQRLFSKGITNQPIERKNGRMIPKNWKFEKAEKYFENVSIKNKEKENVLTVTQDKGIILREDCGIDIKYDINSLKNYKYLKRGQFVISLRSFQGGIEYSDISGLVSPAYTILAAKKNICLEFYKYYFKSKKFISDLNNVVEGIRDGKQINYLKFKEILIINPPFEEQKKIANILEVSKRKIDILEKKRKQYLILQKGLMQQLLTEKIRVKI